MLDYFPTPYSDESWYSIVSRYYVKSGSYNNKHTKEKLFGTFNANPSTIFPNATIGRVLNRLPKDVFGMEDMIFNHTAFKYYTLFYPVNEKKVMYEKLLRGELVQLTHLWKTFDRNTYELRYCPICAKEDVETYGEPYYRVCHQVPIYKVCAKHKCKLNNIGVSDCLSKTKTMLIPLSSIDLDLEPDFNIEEHEVEISKVIEKYSCLPFPIELRKKSNNIYQAILNSGYRVFSRGRMAVNKEKLYSDLTKFYGAERTGAVFGEKLLGDKMERIKNFEQYLPDRYIYLQVFLGLDTETALSNKFIGDSLKSRITEISKRDEMTTLNAVASELRLKPYEVKAALKEYQIPEFWMTRIKGKEVVRKTGKLQFTLYESELEIIRKESERLGYRNVQDYMLDCVRYVRAKKGANY